MSRVLTDRGRPGVRVRRRIRDGHVEALKTVVPHLNDGGTAEAPSTLGGPPGRGPERLRNKLAAKGLGRQRAGNRWATRLWYPVRSRRISVSTLNGIGTRFLGNSDPLPDGSYIATEWLCFVMPIVPLRSCRIWPESRGGFFAPTFRFKAAPVPLRRSQVIPLYAVYGLLGCAVLGARIALHDPGPFDVSFRPSSDDVGASLEVKCGSQSGSGVIVEIKQVPKDAYCVVKGIGGARGPRYADVKIWAAGRHTCFANGSYGCD